MSGESGGTQEPQSFGRFQVIRTLGRGGMGLVYLAEDPIIKRKVAIKVVRAEPGLAEDEAQELYTRFEREFQSAGNLQHPNIITVFDVGKEEGATFFAMEYLPGEDLADVLKSDRVLSFKEIADYAHKICSGLDFAHDNGVVHRDIKPANILIDHNGEPKITDFGVAKLTSTNLTRTGTVVGTPSYMSPEQVTGQEVSGASDQFSVAVILYQMLTGELPFTGDNPTTILYKIVHETPVKPHEKKQSLPAQVDKVLLRALEKKPEARYERCIDLANALREALGVAAQELDLDFDRPDSTLQMRHHSAKVGKRGQKAAGAGGSRSRTPLIAAAVGAVLVAAAAGFYFVAGRAGGEGDVDGPGAAATAGIRRTLIIQADQGGAEIFRNGVSTGLFVPAELHIEEPEGAEIQLELRREGHVVASRSLLVAPTMATEWTATEQPLPGATYTVASRPSGATVYLGDEQIGVTPAQIDLVEGRDYSLRLELAGHHDESLDFSFPDGVSAEAAAEQQLFFPLRETIPPGRLQVEASYAFVVEVGGRRHGPARSHNISLKPDTYAVRIRSDEVFLDESRQVGLASGDSVRLDLPQAVNVRVAAQPGNCKVSINGRMIDETPFTQPLIPGRYEFRFEWPALGETRTLVEAISAGTTDVFGAPN